MQTHRLLFFVLPILAGCVETPLHSTDIQIAPSSLSNTELRLPLDDKSGDIFLRFGDSQFAMDGSDVFPVSVGGAYRYARASGNEVLITYDLDASPAELSHGRLQTRLKFASASSGTYFIKYVLGKRTILESKGPFVLEQKHFTILPDSIINHQFIFTVNNEVEDSTAEPIRQIRFQHEQDKNSYFQINGKKWFSGEYVENRLDDTTLELAGELMESRQPYQLKTHFVGLTHGTFTLIRGGDKSLITGNFDLIKFTPIDTSSMKGQLIEGNKFLSSFTKIEYPYEVYLPLDYNSSSKKYPVIYVSDGQWFSVLSYLLDRKNKQAVLVAIDEGPENRRGTDYQLPGSKLYSRFLKEEFIPFIETHYNVSQDRTYFGFSLGGALGGYLISQEPVGTPYFKNYILADPSCWDLTPDVIAAEQKRYNASRSLPITLLISYTRSGNAHSVKPYVKRFQNRHYYDMKIYTKEYKLTHEEAGSPAFDDFIDVLY